MSDIYDIESNKNIEVCYSDTVITVHKVSHNIGRGFGGEAPEKTFGC